MQDIVKRLERCESDIEDLKTKDNNLTEKQTRMEVKLEYICQILNDLKIKIDKLVERPSKRWDTIINAIITAAITIVVTSVIAATVFSKAVR